MEAIFSQIPQAILAKAINENNISLRKKARFNEDYEPYISDSLNLSNSQTFTTIINEEETSNETPEFAVPIIISKKTNQPIKSIIKPEVVALAQNDLGIKPTRDVSFLPDSSSSQKLTLDAITQTGPGPVMISRHVQTDPMLTYDDYKRKMMRESMSSNADPVYSLKNNNPPPLKVGLSLKGVKRKVYYPDEEEEEEGEKFKENKSFRRQY